MEETTNSQSIVQAEAPASPTVADLSAGVTKPAKVKKPFPVKLVLIILATLIVVAGVVFAIIHFTNQGQDAEEPTSSVPDTVAPASPEEAAKPSYTLERDAETGEYELFGSDESKNNSGEAFVEYQNAIASSADSSQAEVFDAKISQIVYYTAIELYNEAQSVIDSIDQSTLSADQQERLTNVINRLTAAQNGE